MLHTAQEGSVRTHSWVRFSIRAHKYKCWGGQRTALTAAVLGIQLADDLITVKFRVPQLRCRFIQRILFSMYLAPSDATEGSALRAGAALDSPDDDSTAWLRSRGRHYFIISNGGRPIYTRHGQPNDAAALSALLFGLASVAHDALGASSQWAAYLSAPVAVCKSVTAGEQSARSPLNDGKHTQVVHSIRGRIQ